MLFQLVHIHSADQNHHPAAFHTQRRSWLHVSQLRLRSDGRFRWGNPLYQVSLLLSNQSGFIRFILLFILFSYCEKRAFILRLWVWLLSFFLSIRLPPVHSFLSLSSSSGWGMKEDRPKPKIVFLPVMLTNIHLFVIFFCSVPCLWLFFLIPTFFWAFFLFSPSSTPQLPLKMQQEVSHTCCRVSALCRGVVGGVSVPEAGWSEWGFSHPLLISLWWRGLSLSKTDDGTKNFKEMKEWQMKDFICIPTERRW